MMAHWRAGKPRNERTPLMERFWRYVEVEPEPDGCWIWTGAKRRYYGAIGMGGRTGRSQFAHIISYEHYVGPVPEGKRLGNLCGRSLCVKPEHWQPMTHKEVANKSASPRR